MIPADKIAELRRLLLVNPDFAVSMELAAAAREWFPALLALAERPSSEEVEALAKRLEGRIEEVYGGHGTVKAFPYTPKREYVDR